MRIYSRNIDNHNEEEKSQGDNSLSVKDHGVSIAVKDQ